MALHFFLSNYYFKLNLQSEKCHVVKKKLFKKYIIIKY